jgi:hypothetical protein
MGAAPTYARRYALFTLVGIAGEDDLDAPDLLPAQAHDATGAKASVGNGSQKIAPAAAPSTNANAARRKFPERRPMLSAEASARLRDQLLAEVLGLRSTDAMIAWAQDSLPLKNTLVAPDADAVDKAFRVKAEQLDVQLPAPQATDQRTAALQPGREAPAEGGYMDGSASSNEPVPEAVPVRQSAHAVPSRRQVVSRTRRIRDRRHLEFITTQPCLVCGRHPCEAHHLRFSQPRALGRRVSDEFTVSLCRIHHDEIHRRGDEVAWWASLNIDPLPTALRFWQHTRGLLPADAALSSNTPATPDPGCNVGPNPHGGAESSSAANLGQSQR